MQGVEVFSSLLRHQNFIKELKKCLSKIKVWVPFKIDHEGTQIIFRKETKWNLKIKLNH